MNESHPCKGLVKAFKLQNKNIANFLFIVRESGPGWSDQEVRLARENELIRQNIHRCYNQNPDLPNKNESGRLKNPVMAEGVRYESVREAAKAYKCSRSTMKRYVEGNDKPDFFYLAAEPYGCTPIFAKKGEGPSVLFPSIGDAVKAGYATTKQNATRKLNRGDEGWRYAHFDKENKPLRIPYQLKSGEMSYEQYCESLGV